MLCVGLLLAFPRSVFAEDELTGVQSKILSELDLTQVEEAVDQLLDENEFSFFQTIKDLLSGKMPLTAENLEPVITDIILGQLKSQKQIVLQVLMLVLLSALLTTFSQVFESGQISEMAFYVVYLVVFVLLLKGFQNLAGDLQMVLGGSLEFMKVLAPAYYLATALANGVNTAGAYYAGVLLVIYLVEWILLHVVMPGIQVYVLVGIVNHLAKEDYLSRMADLLKTVLVWIMRSLVGVVAGFQIIQRLVSPMLDTVQRSFLGKTAGALPAIGNLIDSTSEIMIGCALLIRNCIGAASLIVLLFASMGPIAQLGIATLLYRATAAIVQPIADKRMVGCITIMGDGCALLMRVLLTAQLLFFVTIAIVAGGSV